jgi:periplasmic protein CpxP/Spy
MSDQTLGGETQTPKDAPPRRGRRWLVAVFIGAAAIFGFAAGKVHSAPWWHWAGHHRFFDAEEVSFFVQHRIDRVLAAVDATPEQREKIHAIAKGAIDDVLAMRRDPAARREKVLALMKADTVDRQALEALRAEQIATADAATKRILQAVEDAAEVLRPEQRRQLAERWERWSPHR